VKPLYRRADERLQHLPAALRCGTGILACVVESALNAKTTQARMPVPQNPGHPLPESPLIPAIVRPQAVASILIGSGQDLVLPCVHQARVSQIPRFVGSACAATALNGFLPAIPPQSPAAVILAVPFSGTVREAIEIYVGATPVLALKRLHFPARCGLPWSSAGPSLRTRCGA